MRGHRTGNVNVTVIPVTVTTYCAAGLAVVTMEAGGVMGRQVDRSRWSH